MHAICGDTATAHPLVMLIQALENASPGDKLIVATFAQGCTALLFEVTDQISLMKNKRGIKGSLADKLAETNYIKFLSHRGMLDEQDWMIRAEGNWRTALSTLYRHHKTIIGLVGGRCEKCGTAQFPKSDICVNPECLAFNSQIDCEFADQKGIDILIETLPSIAECECNIALLGEGEKRYIDALMKLENEHKNIVLHLGYDEVLSHKMYAAADFLVMPSLFEPCGLNQMIAFVYGTIPIVHRVGGLSDTVKRCEKYQQDSCAGYGIVFNAPSSRSLLSAMRKGCELYSDKKHWERIVNHNMKADFSWQESAKAYATLYEKVNA